MHKLQEITLGAYVHITGRSEAAFTISKIKLSDFFQNFRRYTSQDIALQSAYLYEVVTKISPRILTWNSKPRWRLLKSIYVSINMNNNYICLFGCPLFPEVEKLERPTLRT